MPHTLFFGKICGMRVLAWLSLFFLVAPLWAVEPPVESPVAQLFVHPLIAWPAMAFMDGNADESRMDEWFVTTEEFERSLASLEERGYILVRASDIYEISGTRVILKAPPVPAGRRPLVLSVDDLNYYRYMKANGTVSRLKVIDNELVAQTLQPGGTYLNSTDKEVPQVLEAFIAAHPDFSWKGARGLIAVTGYAGLFGWPTQWAGPGLKEAKEQAKAVADKLKEMGWEFASHSYSHRSDKLQSFDDWNASELRWDNEIAPLIGPTPFYIFPFGERWWTYPERWSLLKAKDYKLFFGVETTSNLRWQDDLPILGRVPLDGRGLRRKHGLLSPFVDTKQILDAARPPVIKY